MNLPVWRERASNNHKTAPLSQTHKPKVLNAEPKAGCKEGRRPFQTVTHFPCWRYTRPEARIERLQQQQQQEATFTHNIIIWYILRGPY